MKNKYNPSGTTPITSKEAMKLLEIEGLPLSSEALARHQQFERDGTDTEERIKEIIALHTSPVLAAE